MLCILLLQMFPTSPLPARYSISFVAFLLRTFPSDALIDDVCTSTLSRYSKMFDPGLYTRFSQSNSFHICCNSLRIVHRFCTLRKHPNKKTYLPQHDFFFFSLILSYFQIVFDSYADLTLSFTIFSKNNQRYLKQKMDL